MSDFELFSTKDEALSFIRGYEAAIGLLDDGETTVSAHPTLTLTGEWQVDYGYPISRLLN